MKNRVKFARYRSFLLRLWEDSDTHIWRFSLEDPHTGERRGLADLDAVVAFLKEVMEQAEHNEPIPHSSA